MIANPGSLADLVGRGDGRPIWCMPTNAVSRALMTTVIDSFRRAFPRAEFINARGLYRDWVFWRARWRAEQFGAGIVVTRTESHSSNAADPFDGINGEHVVGIRAKLEIQTLAGLGRPVGWHATVFPANYWHSRFAILPFDTISTARYAELLPFSDAEPFRPMIEQWSGWRIVPQPA
jgi:hypothetical protein